DPRPVGGLADGDGVCRGRHGAAAVLRAYLVEDGPGAAGVHGGGLTCGRMLRRRPGAARRRPGHSVEPVPPVDASCSRAHWRKSFSGVKGRSKSMLMVILSVA